MIDWRQKLAELAQGNEEYAAFHARIVNTKQRVLGVRVPDVRKLAWQLAQEMTDCAAVEAFLDAIDPKVFEEVLLAGLIINAAKLSSPEHVELSRRYLAWADSWAAIDIFVERKSRFATDEYWHFATEMANRGEEFLARYGIIMYMSNFLDEAHTDRIFLQLRRLKSDAYYVKMACAWLYASAAIDFFDATMTELENSAIDRWTRAKAYQKMLESRRISDVQKADIRRAKKNYGKKERSA